MDDFKLDTEYVGFEIEFRYVWWFRYVIPCNFAIYLLHRTIEFWIFF